MPTNNFKLFDENKANILTDSDYEQNTQRLNGVQTGIASSQLQNKTLYQTTLMAYAMAQMMNAQGFDASDSLAVSAFVSNYQEALKKITTDITDVIKENIIEIEQNVQTALKASSSCFELITSSSVGLKLATSITYTNTIMNLPVVDYSKYNCLLFNICYKINNSTTISTSERVLSIYAGNSSATSYNNGIEISRLRISYPGSNQSSYALKSDSFFVFNNYNGYITSNQSDISESYKTSVTLASLRKLIFTDIRISSQDQPTSISCKIKIYGLKNGS